MKSEAKYGINVEKSVLAGFKGFFIFFRKNFFTLIEMLVCTAILMILMSITMPALKKAKQYAYIASCLSQLKQHGLWYYYYVDEQKNMWPPHYVEGRQGGYWWFSPGKSGIWLGFIKPPPGQLKKGTLVYDPGKDPQGGMAWLNMSLCPADTNPTRRDYVDIDGNEYLNIPISYAYNLLLYTKGIPHGRLKRPNEIVVLFDAHDLIQQQGENPEQLDYYYNVLAERHNRGANHLFTDFHAEWKPKITVQNLIPE